jgi:hypothetical protein
MKEMRSFADYRALPYIALAAIVILPLGDWLAHGTEWSTGPLRFARHVVEAISFISIGLVGYALRKRSLAAYPSEVWFSTRAQFEAFDDAVANASRLRKLLGRYRIRKGGAYVKLLPWMKIPLVLVRRGKLAIEADYIRFSPLARRDRIGRRARNLLDDFAFDLKASEIVSVEAYDHPQMQSRYALPWTRVLTSRDAPLDDFLVSVGGPNVYGMRKYCEEALKLRDDLQSLIASKH